MADQYSIAAARHNLAALVHALDKQEPIELTRRGEPVAVLLSMRAYRRLSAPQTDFWDAHQRFRKAHPLTALNIQPELFEDVRDPSKGREMIW